jgi:hypothetical protein
MTTVTLTYDPTWKAVEWAKENCPSYITNDVHQNGDNIYDRTKIDYHFSDEKDAIMFLLRWA